MFPTFIYRKTHSQTTTVEDIDVTQKPSAPEEGTIQAIATEDEWTSDVEQVLISLTLLVHVIHL